ncbi:MAG: carboxymuconolactone decarboxylase family protein [Planctomycetes bacterium]|nr:carboxymuconolactone decarboxylase family protein [Planctomycetota bacterium]
MVRRRRLKKAPPAYQLFVKRFPGLGRAWEQLGDAGAAAGPLDARTQRLIKLALAIGSRQEGAVHSGVRKALAAGATAAELEQVVALAASLIGLPATVAAFCQVREELLKEGAGKP